MIRIQTVKLGTTERIVLGALVVVVLVLAGWLIFGGASNAPARSTDVAPEEQAAVEAIIDTATGMTKYKFTRVDYEFEPRSLAGSTNAQDSVSDVDIDIFEAPGSAITKLYNKRYVDCRNAVVAEIDVDVGTMYELKEDNFCEINTYKFWSDSNFNAGNSETRFTTEQVVQPSAASDLDGVDGSGTKEFTGRAEVVYLATVAEEGTGDDEDIIPHAFLFKTKGVSLQELVADKVGGGTNNVRLIWNYYADAGAHSKLDFAGKCSDDQNHNNDPVDGNWNGTIHSALTTATTVNYDCDLDVKVSARGFGLVLKNPIASIPTEKPYLKFSPYGERDDDVWTETGTSNMTFSNVIYSSSNSGSRQVIHSGSSACGEVLTTSSTSNAIAKAGEELRDTSCMDVAQRRNGVWGVWGEETPDTLTLDVHIQGIKVDYDASSSAGNEQVDGNSGTCAEPFMKIYLVTTESTTDRIAKELC